MKRVIKFFNQFSDEGFSDCGTHYEVLPILVPDNAGCKELIAIAQKLEIPLKSKTVSYFKREREWETKTFVTHNVELKEVHKRHNGEERPMFLGFVTLQENGPLVAREKLGGRINKEQAREIVDHRKYGVDDVGEYAPQGRQRKNRPFVVMSGWNYYHEMRLLGYDHDQFQTLMGAAKDGEGRDFYDSVDRCSECGIWDSRDNGYTYNHRHEDDGTFGVNCGCFHEHCKANFLDMGNKPKKAMELEVAQALEKEGKIEFMQRYIGGMTNGRGGYFGGESVGEGTPEGVLAEMQKQNPKSVFVFSHDESGQFQTYFSVWRVTKKGLESAKKGRAA